MGEHEEDRPVSPARLSKTPSWITLGFVLGALFVLALPRGDKSGASTPPPAPEPRLVRLERPTLSEIEAVFADWGESAIWQNDVTEVALWDAPRRSYSLFYEVVRHNGAYYFRSIPQLTRPLLTEGVPPNSPLQYTTPVGVRETRARREFQPPRDDRRPTMVPTAEPAGGVVPPPRSDLPLPGADAAGPAADGKAD